MPVNQYYRVFQTLLAPILFSLLVVGVRGQLWVGGSDEINEFGTYNSGGGDAPGARSGALSWTDNNGGVWLFGGRGYGTGTAGSFQPSGLLNDLWLYDTTTGVWKWMSGASTPGKLGVYNMSTLNVPGGRSKSCTWVDSGNKLWLFGGYGLGSGKNEGWLNDLWSYNIVTGIWTWVSGSSTINFNGVYNNPTNNIPGGRASSACWMDSSNNLWVFGGAGYLASELEYQNDMWSYTFATGVWSWLGGSDLPDRHGIYDNNNPNATPGGRQGSAYWQAGNLFYLFGGNGYSNSSSGTMNDFWTYNPATDRWTWIGGSSGTQASGVYNRTTGSNFPGARKDANAWVDKEGMAWLFGGRGFASNGSGNYLNDLWSYNPITGVWKWVSGLSVAGGQGIYNNFTGEGMAGSRSASSSWVDINGQLWVFGGMGLGATSVEGSLNDVWILANFYDFCKLNNPMCGPNAECRNKASNYTCTCEDGYVGDGYKCYECDATLTCSTHGTCDVSNGNCQCDFGWDGPNCDVCSPDFYGPFCNSTVPLTTGSPAESSTTGSNGGNSGGGFVMYFGIVCGVIVVVAIAVVSVLYVFVVQKRRRFTTLA